MTKYTHHYYLRSRDITKTVKTVPLPTDEELLLLADMCHNLLGSKGYNTIAIGAVGRSNRAIHLILGINSSEDSSENISKKFPKHEVQIKKPKAIITKARAVPGKIKNHRITKDYNIYDVCEDYHAETSIVLYAKKHGLKIFGLAASRKICNDCYDLLFRHNTLFDKDCTPVDSWEYKNKLLIQRQRAEILADEKSAFLITRIAKAVNERAWKAMRQQ